MKSLGGELTSLAVTLAIPAAVVCVFPYGAAEFRAADPAATADPAAAFVTLSPEEESAATHAAKASWQGSREGARAGSPRRWLAHAPAAAREHGLAGAAAPAAHGGPAPSADRAGAAGAGQAALPARRDAANRRLRARHAMNPGHLTTQPL